MGPACGFFDLFGCLVGQLYNKLCVTCKRQALTLLYRLCLICSVIDSVIWAQAAASYGRPPAAGLVASLWGVQLCCLLVQWLFHSLLAPINALSPMALQSIVRAQAAVSTKLTEQNLKGGENKQGLPKQESYTDGPARGKLFPLPPVSKGSQIVLIVLVIVLTGYR